MSKKYSAIVHSLTPFNSKFELDETALRKHLRRLGDAGVSVYLGAAGAAEGYSLTRAEYERVLAIGVEELKGKVWVRAAGCEQHTTTGMVELVRSAEAMKVDSAQVYSLDMGHGLKPTRTEMENYFRTVIEATSLPVTISNQIKVGYSLPFDLIEDLVSHYPNVTGFAYDAKDPMYMYELIKRFGERLEIHCSGPEGALYTLGLGGNGFQGLDGNVTPALYSSVATAFAAGDTSRVHESFRMIMGLRTIFTRPGRDAMRAIKPLLNAFGLSGGHVRQPRSPISAEELDVVIKAVLDLKIPEMANWKLQR